MSYVLRSNTFSVYLVLLFLTLEVISKSLKKCLLLLFLNIHSLFFGVGRGHLNLLWLNWQSSSLSGANQKAKQNQLKKKSVLSITELIWDITRGTETVGLPSQITLFANLQADQGLSRSVFNSWKMREWFQLEILRRQEERVLKVGHCWSVTCCKYKS